MPASNTNTWYFLAANGKVYQINGVVKITIASPLIANGTYRDTPPVIAGAAAATGGANQNLVIGGGTTQTVTNPGGTVPLNIIAPSSVVQDDHFLHTALRYVFGPMCLIFFQTDAAISTNPTNASFSTERPAVPPATGGFFETFDVDCVFPWTVDCGCFNSPPQGWTPNASR